MNAELYSKNLKKIDPLEYLGVNLSGDNIEMYLREIYFEHTFYIFCINLAQDRDQ